MTGADEQDVQGARAVHTLDPDQLNVAGGRGAGDERMRTSRIQPRERVGQVRGDLVLPDDDQVCGRLGPSRTRSPSS